MKSSIYFHLYQLLMHRILDVLAVVARRTKYPTIEIPVTHVIGEITFEKYNLCNGITQCCGKIEICIRRSSINP
jgi:hypothetical protein